MLPLERVRRIPGHDARHVNERDKWQSRIPVNDCEHLMDVVKRHFIGAVISTIGGGSGFAVPGSDASRDALGAIVVCRDTGGYGGKNGGRSGLWTHAKVHRGQVEHSNRRIAIADEQSIAVGTYLEAVRPGHWIHAVGT